MTYHGSTVSVQIPERIFLRLQRISEATYRPIEEVLATTISVALPHSPDLPSEIDDDLSAMTMFSDDALKAAVESSLSPSLRRRLNQLSHAGGQRPLSAAESAELVHLVDLYDRAVLRRARALAILAHRGYPVADQDSAPKITWRRELNRGAEKMEL
jgi:hypothetical protein